MQVTRARDGHQHPLQRDEVLRDHLRVHPNRTRQQVNRTANSFFRHYRKPDGTLRHHRRLRRRQRKRLGSPELEQRHRVPRHPQHHRVPDGSELFDLLQLDSFRHPRSHSIHPIDLLQRANLLGYSEKEETEDGKVT